MIYRIELREAIIYGEKVCCKSPNKYNGIGNFEIITEYIWTGNEHIYFEKPVKMLIMLSYIRNISTRSDQCESDEKWKTIFTYKPQTFTYEYWHGVAKKLKKIIGE